MIDLLILATEGTEGIPPEHIAAKLAVPLGIVIFSGSVYLLLWANYGAKKGAFIYGTAFFAFTTMLGVFWWFGAPGTPVATGLRNFPGQAPDAYEGAWFAMEPGSERAQIFPATNSLENFQGVAAYIGKPGASEEALADDPHAQFIAGDLSQAADRMRALFMPRDEAGSLRIGGQRRKEYQDTASEMLAQEVDDPDQWSRGDPFLEAVVDGDVLATDSNGTRVAAARFDVLAHFTTDGEAISFVVDDDSPMFAFKDPGAIWFPSAVWTVVSLGLFLLSLLGLDRMEQREKRLQEEVEEPEDLAVPIAQ